MKCTAAFVTSATSAGGFPKERLPEVALVGRSNVGKSSLINALVRQQVARISAAPGKTRLANVYRVVPASAPAFYLIDLPGYGYTRGGDAAARQFEAVARSFFGRFEATPGSPGEDRGRKPQLAGAFLLVDSRHPELDPDRRAWEWLGTLGRPRRLVTTKVDKLTRAERQRHLNTLHATYQCPPAAVSAASGEGLEELWTQIAKLLRQPLPEPVS